MPIKHPQERTCPACGQPAGSGCLTPTGAPLGDAKNPVHHTSRLIGNAETAPRKASAPASERAAEHNRPNGRARSRPPRAQHPASPTPPAGDVAPTYAQPALF